MDFEREWSARLGELEALDPARVPGESERVVATLVDFAELKGRLEALSEDFFSLLTQAPRRALAQVALAEAYARTRGEAARLSELVLRRATAQFMLGCCAAAAEATALELARLGRSGSSAERLALLTLRGQALIARGELRPALVALEEALALARAQPRQPLLGVVLSAFGNARLHGGDLESAGEYYREALDRGRIQGQVEGEAVNLGNLGLVQFLSGDYPAAEGAYSEALGLAIGDEDRRAVTVVEANLGLLLTERGELAQAEKLLEGASARSRGAGDAQRARHCLVRLARVARERADFALAAERLVAARGRTEGCAETDLSQVELELESARLALAQGEPAQALGHARAGGAAAASLGYVAGVAHGQLVESRAQLALGKGPEAWRSAEAARDAGRELGQPLLRGWAALSLAQASALVPGTDPLVRERALLEAKRTLPAGWPAGGWLELARALLEDEEPEELQGALEELAERAGQKGWGELERAARAARSGAS